MPPWHVFFCPNADTNAPRPEMLDGTQASIELKYAEPLPQLLASRDPVPAFQNE